LTEKSSGGGGGSSGSSSSSGSGGSPDPQSNVEVKELSQTFITSGKPTKLDFTKNATCVVYVSFDSKKTSGKTTTIVEMLKRKSTLVSELSAGEVYSILICGSETVGMRPQRISKTHSYVSRSKNPG
jgi:PGF-pre-PGF domain-containing protein